MLNRGNNSLIININDSEHADVRLCTQPEKNENGFTAAAYTRAHIGTHQ